jgi:hypothetical protein
MNSESPDVLTINDSDDDDDDDNNHNVLSAAPAERKLETCNKLNIVTENKFHFRGERAIELSTGVYSTLARRCIPEYISKTGSLIKQEII